MTHTAADKTPVRVSVIGDGGWGTALALHLHRRGISCLLWGAYPEYVDFLKHRRENVKFLPGVTIPGDLPISADTGQAMAHADLVVLAVPSQYMRGVCKKLVPFVKKEVIWVNVAKGIERGSLCRMSEVMAQEIGAKRYCVLSGPSHAEEVMRCLPTTAVAASEDMDAARTVQKIFFSESFRVYTNSDVVGVELGGSLKNVIAIAVGISDGMGYGDNAKAALMTRGMVEISRLGLALGARAQTFAGLSGMGDLITTCISHFSRNRNFGQWIGQGMDVQRALKQTEMVVEGVGTSESAKMLAKKCKVEVPIIDEVYSVIYESKSSEKAVRDLLRRDPKSEIEIKL